MPRDQNAVRQLIDEYHERPYRKPGSSGQSGPANRGLEKAGGDSIPLHALSPTRKGRSAHERIQPAVLPALADGASTAQHLSGGTLVAKNRPNVLVFQSTFFHQCVQRLVGRHAGQRIILLFVIFDKERQHFGERLLLW